MTTDNLSATQLTDFVDKLLDQTGKIALNYFRQTRNLSLKSDQSPVTHADREIETLIRKNIQKAYPTHNIIGEEFEDLNN